MHHKIDLLTDEEMAHFETKVGDELELPDSNNVVKQYQVTNIEISDAGTHPESGIRLTRVMLTLE